jgi:hypothetical protein
LKNAKAMAAILGALDLSKLHAFFLNFSELAFVFLLPFFMFFILRSNRGTTSFAVQ